MLHVWLWPLILIHTDHWYQRKEIYTSTPLMPFSFYTCPPVIQPFCTCECAYWQLHPSLVTNTFKWLTLARESWKEYKAGREGEAWRDSITTIHGTSFYGLHTALPLCIFRVWPSKCVLQNPWVPWAIFWGSASLSCLQ